MSDRGFSGQADKLLVHSAAGRRDGRGRKRKKRRDLGDNIFHH